MMKVDYHVHTCFSDGEASAEYVLDKAAETGLESIAITDHFDKYDENPKICLLTETALYAHFYRIREYAARIGVKVLCGIETCTDFYGKLRLNDRVVELCDLIITSPHYIEYEGELKPGGYFNDMYWSRYKEKVLHMAEGEGTILGHCEGYLPVGAMLVPGAATFEERIELCGSISERYFDDAYLDRLAAALKKSGKAIELHCPTRSPREKVVKKMADMGVAFSIGSDAHLLDWVGRTAWGCEVLEKYKGVLSHKLNIKG